LKYIIMAGGEYKKWETPRHLTEIKGEPIIARTIRLLKENGVEDIAISSNNPVFEQFGVPVLNHKNNYVAYEYNVCDGLWAEAFYPSDEPVCYIFGDVVFSEKAIKIIVETNTPSIQFFASTPPFDSKYIKKWAEPFALKVNDTARFKSCLYFNKLFYEMGLFARKPIMWELWQLIKKTPLNIIDYTNYVAINDYTCDVDDPEDAKLIERKMG